MPFKTDEEHYKTLNASPDSSWNDLRKSYKKQIQKFHPDRQVAGSAEELDAQEHIKQLNLAYQHFLTFYKTNGHLPRRSQNEKVENEPIIARSFEFTPQETFTETAPKPETTHTRSSKLRQSYIFVSFIVGITAYLFVDFSETNILSIEPEKPTDNVTERKLPNQVFHEKPNQNFKENRNITEPVSVDSRGLTQEKHVSLDKNKSYFTYGSSMGSVLDAQGIPDKSTENTWHYGQSSVIFKDGVVIDWNRHLDSPLNAAVSASKDIEPRYTPNKEKPEHKIESSASPDQIKPPG